MRKFYKVTVEYDPNRPGESVSEQLRYLAGICERFNAAVQMETYASVVGERRLIIETEQVSKEDS
ncbi:MAG: hypothetical protein WDA42_00835 [Candidatus Bathyarchaeia archaeon]